jgi:hypothetical protein
VCKVGRFFEAVDGIRKVNVRSSGSACQIESTFRIHYNILTLDNLKIHISYYVTEGAYGGFATVRALYIKE